MSIIKKGVKFIFSHSITDSIFKTKSVVEREIRIYMYNKDYNIFLKNNKLSVKELKKEKSYINKLPYKPMVSIIMPTYNSPHKFLRINIESVINQIYSNWELCIADDNSSDSRVREIIKEYAQKDKRIKYVFRKNNGHISNASNSALELAKGEYIALLDHDDILYPNSLSECIKEINKHRDADLIYTDEDKIDIHGYRFEPHFKPDWSPETLLSANYITHFAVIRKKVIDNIKGFRTGYEGAQDLDLFLRIANVTDNIYHIPLVLYSWRTVKTSTATKNSNAKIGYAYKNGLMAISDSLKKRRFLAKVSMGKGNGLYQYSIKNTNKNIDFYIINNKTNYNNDELIKNIQINYPKSIIRTSNIENIENKIFSFIKNSHSSYIFFIDNQCTFNEELIKTSLGFFKINQIKIVSNKIIDKRQKIYKTGIIFTKNNKKINAIDAFYGMTDGGYFNFNYSSMAKNFSASSLLGTIIDTKYFKQHLKEKKNLSNMKEIGIYLSYLTLKNNNRIVYNPDHPIIYKGKYVNNYISKNCESISQLIIAPKQYDQYYNKNLTTHGSDFSINI